MKARPTAGAAALQWSLWDDIPRTCSLIRESDLCLPAGPARPCEFVEIRSPPRRAQRDKGTPAAPGSNLSKTPASTLQVLESQCR